jgi:hypothetical protein
MGPDDRYAAPDPDTEAAARDRVQFPAVFLLLVGVLNLGAAAVPVVIGVAARVVPPEQVEGQLVRDRPGQWEAMRDRGFTIRGLLSLYFYGGLGVGGLIGVTGLLTVLGAARMLVLRSYGLAVFAAIVAAVPFLSPSGCCLLGEMVGLWALVVLLDPDVRAAFG